MVRPRGPRRKNSGATSFQLLAILVPVLFAFMGFAVDLGRLYLVRGELQTAANSMALAAASRLIGTDLATSNATRQAQLLAQDSGLGTNKYDFGAITIGETTGLLSSEIPDPEYFDTLAGALDGTTGAGGQPKYVRIRLRAEAPLLFFGFLPMASERKTPIETLAVAGVSAPLCTACGIEPLAIAAFDSTEPTDFGFQVGSLYTLGFQCTGGPTPALLGEAIQRIPYLLLNRYDTETAVTFAEEGQQAYRNGAAGIPSTTAETYSCMTINTEEAMWASATPGPCNRNSVPSPVGAFSCGLYSRFDSVPPATCSAITEIDTLAGLYAPDSDITESADYASYAGSGRRIITVAVVATLDSNAPMLVLGFRQFLLQPNIAGAIFNTADPNGRFNGIYLGYPVPLKQGRIESCQTTAGPGKVVLHK
jgi:hypothetical protein